MRLRPTRGRSTTIGTPSFVRSDAGPTPERISRAGEWIAPAQTINLPRFPDLGRASRRRCHQGPDRAPTVEQDVSGDPSGDHAQIGTCPHRGRQVADRGGDALARLADHRRRGGDAALPDAVLVLTAGMAEGPPGIR